MVQKSAIRSRSYRLMAATLKLRLIDPKHAMLPRVTHLAFLLFTALGTTAIAQIDFDREPINYKSVTPRDRMFAIKQSLEGGDIKLRKDPQFGYLTSLLEALEISPDSQTLVFTKTSFQIRKISPRMPRAVYFNDEVYVGWVRDSDVIEIAATDPTNGTMFYTLEESLNGPTIARDRGQCLSCHANYRTNGVPGLVMRSIYPSPDGRFVPGAPNYTLDHNSKFEQRWGGWYVTGQHGMLTHLGNAICVDKDDFESLDSSKSFNLENLSDFISADSYLRPGSDIVALLLLEHQTQMHNLITRASFETRSAQHQDALMNNILERPEDYVSDTTKRRIAKASDKLLKYMLFADAPEWSDSVRGNPEFRKHFEGSGPRDGQGRGLHQLELNKRLLKHPLSYLVHSEAFKRLPLAVMEHLGSNLHTILAGEKAEEFPNLSSSDRDAIASILRDTEPKFWQEFVR